MKKLKVAVIGAGFGAAVHIPAFKAHPRCEVTTFCASRREKAQEIAAQNNIPVFTDRWHETLRDPGIDIVSIAVPPVEQEKIILAALKEKKHVFAEKPLTASSNGAKLVLKKAALSRSIHMVDFEFLEVPAWKKAAEILNKGTLGKLRHAGVSWNIETYSNKAGLKSWKSDEAKGGGALNAFTSHVFYYLEALLGSIRSMNASISRFKEAPGDADTLNCLNLEVTSKIPVTVTVSTHSFSGSGHRFEVYGDRGSLVLENKTKDYIKGFKLFVATRQNGEGFDEVVVRDSAARTNSDGRVAAVSSMVRRFVQAIETGKAVKPNFQHGARVQRLIELARLSSRKKCAVRCL